MEKGEQIAVVQGDGLPKIKVGWVVWMVFHKFHRHFFSEVEFFFSQS